MLWRSALELAALIRTKQVSPVEVTERVLARIGLLNPRLNAFCLVAADAARDAAREAEIAVMKGEPLGLLHGVPVSVKDVLDTRGIRTTGGSRLFAELCPSTTRSRWRGCGRPAPSSSARPTPRSSATRRSPRARSSA